MTKYGGFIVYFTLEKMPKRINLCKNRPKGPLFMPWLTIKAYDICVSHLVLKEGVPIGSLAEFQEIVFVFCFVLIVV